MEAQWSPQWSLNGRYWSAKGGTIAVQGRQKRRSNWYTMFTTVRIFYGAINGRSHSIQSATTAICVPPSYLLWATFVRLFWTCSKLHGDHGDVWTPCVLVYHPWTTKATVRPPFCLQPRPGQSCGRTREAQRSQPLCKGGINGIFWTLYVLPRAPLTNINQLQEIRACISNYIHQFVRDTISHPCPNFNGRGWVITSHCLGVCMIIYPCPKPRLIS